MSKWYPDRKNIWPKNNLIFHLMYVHAEFFLENAMVLHYVDEKITRFVSFLFVQVVGGTWGRWQEDWASVQRSAKD